MKKGLCEIIAIIDRSGSMETIRNDAIGGFNNFLKEQKAHPGEALFTLLKFHHEYEVVCEGIPIAEVQPFTHETYVPTGATALLDAVGRAVTDAGMRFAAMPEDKRPEKVIVFIITDGEENSSKEYKKEAVKTIVERQQKDYKWAFIFCGAGIDAFHEAGSFGVNPKFVLNVSHDSEGTRDAYNYASTTTTSLRSDTS